MYTVDWSETSVNFCQATQLHNLEHNPGIDRALESKVSSCIP
jgi:hypothetical protein